MKPLEICLENCNELISDELRRELGEKARKDAESDSFDPPVSEMQTYWDGIVLEHKRIFYTDMFNRRKARLERMKNKP